MHRAFILFVATLTAAPACAQSAPFDLSAARASLVGRWAGQLEYLDYGANKWFGIPVTTTIEDQGDGATTIRRSDFNDGPKVGNVRITTVELFDAAKGMLTSATFRKGRTVDIMTYTVRLDPVGKDAAHWTMIEEARGTDDDRSVTLRLTTVCNGDSIETLKRVDFLDDAKAAWLTRNRTRMTRAR